MCGFLVCLSYNGFDLYLVFGIINLKVDSPFHLEKNGEIKIRF